MVKKAITKVDISHNMSPTVQEDGVFPQSLDKYNTATKAPSTQLSNNIYISPAAR